MGEEAMTLLRRLISGEADPGTKIRLDVSLSIRQSCGCPPPFVPEVATGTVNPLRSAESHPGHHPPLPEGGLL
jgi:hypothetical protein